MLVNMKSDKAARTLRGFMAMAGAVGLCAAAHAQSVPPSAAAAAAPAWFSGADTAWMLISTVLVTLMVVPGIALFYAGMVRRKNALAVTAQVLGSAAVVTLVWMSAGYGVAFGEGGPWYGSLTDSLLFSDRLSAAAKAHPLAPTIPETVFLMFQLAFAMVAVALVLGAVVERFRFGAAMVFSALWVAIVYAPVAHWVWHPEGWLHQIGHVDAAGGTVVHLAAGVAGLVLAGMTGPRIGYGRSVLAPHNLMYTATGVGLLWVGWFGFNGGSAMAASVGAGMAVLLTQVAAAAGVAGWLVCEWFLRRRVTLLGLASGLVAGMIAITPASGSVGTGAAALIGLFSGVFCFFAATAVKARLNYDDSLDVFGLHGVAGFVGTVLTGVFKPGSGDVLAQTGTQIFGALAVVLYVAAATGLIALFLRIVTGLRVSSESEKQGLDMAQHGESLAD